ncbi:hypothetical protein KIH39_23230 [Telmatocola sphagniphila]|uniref:Uncharacterized protein n=1 Tax=Telmatocola sphagniphila TaxID=1123043 RepID=A0A8E6B4F4_9BACT|nr:hypothetical protein [Telmatocola sphagniphila]QVL31722.1 hypothetical protein KIH39_23230 [Telmatocola sphagniphila]
MENEFPYDLQMWDPFRRLDGRLRRAKAILDANIRRLSRDDAETLTIARHLGAKFRGKKTLSKEGLAEALALPRTHATLLPKLQAWILTKASDQQLSDRFGIPAEVICWYERSQYHVRPWLHYHDWVLRTAIVHSSDGEPRTSNIYPERWFAYCGGEKILECYYATIGNEPFPDWMTNSRAYRREADQLRFRIQLLIQDGLLTCRSEAELRRLLRVYENLCTAANHPIPPYSRILDLAASKQPFWLTNLAPQMPDETPFNSNASDNSEFCLASIRQQIENLLGART